MIRIVCPSCHSPLSRAELEQATIDDHAQVPVDRCSMVLLTEPVDEHLIQHPEEAPAHA